MTDRIGTCRGCGSQFKVPESFQGTKAKCKKCGGIVEIPAAGAAPPPAATPPAPAAPAAPARPAAPATARRAAPTRSSRPPSRSGSTIRAGAGAAARNTRPGREEAAAKKGGGSSAVTWIAIAALVLVAGGAAIFIMKGKKPPVVEPTTETASTPKTPAKDATPAPAPKTEPAPAASAPAPAPASAPAPAASAPAETAPAAPVATKIDFPPFTKLADMTDEEWTALQAAVHTEYIHFDRPKDRKPAQKLIAEAQEKAVPALANAFIGLDTANAEDAPKISRLLYAIQDDAVLKVIGIPFHDTMNPSEEDAQYNADHILKFVAKWKEYVDDPVKMGKVRAKIAEARGKAAAEPKDTGDGG